MNRAHNETIQLLRAMRSLSLPQCVWIVLQSCFSTASTLKLLLPVLPTLSSMPSFHFFSPLLFCSLLLASLLHPLKTLRFPLLAQLQVPLVLRLDLRVDPLLKITERWRGLQNIQWLHVNHTFYSMTSKVLEQKYTFSPAAQCEPYEVVGRRNNLRTSSTSAYTCPLHQTRLPCKDRRKSTSAQELH